MSTPKRLFVDLPADVYVTAAKLWEHVDDGYNPEITCPEGWSAVISVQVQVHGPGGIRRFTNKVPSGLRATLEEAKATAVEAVERLWGCTLGDIQWVEVTS